MRVGAEKMALLCRHPRTFAVGDARIALQRGRFAGQSQLCGAVAVDIPGVEQVQVRRRAAGDVSLIGQGGKRVLRGEAGNIVGGLHRALYGLWRKIRRAGVASPGAQVNGYAQRFVAVAFHVFELAFAH